MLKVSGKRMAFGAAVAMCALTLAPAAQAEDFLSALFGVFGGHHRAPMIRMPYASETAPDATEGDPITIPPNDVPRPRVYGGGAAFCVRTCDGRYFPLAGTDRESRAASCNSFCPASNTEIVYGGNIDIAATENGKPYSELPNAFRYRNEIVAGCTCNGKDQFGLARVSIENDPTIRRGDLVAGADGLMVASSSADKRHAQLNFSLVPKSALARYGRVPVVARE
jgi:hypothetical protein